mmetsp:Transcript_121656/g.190018  ORF Transcript_121656/g.190018 Transcript_121656/m.190018 type:complete len:390 (-) Transcript_121656:25-1194(-)
MFRRRGGRRRGWNLGSLVSKGPLAPGGTLRLDEVAKQSVPTALTFSLVLLLLIQPYRFSMGFLTNAVTVIASLVCIYGPGLAFVVFAVGIFKTIYSSVARLSAVIFWSFWPVWIFLCRVFAVVLAWCLGNYLWFNNFQAYTEYEHLQAYSNVDSFTQTGNRLQDAGLVVFNASDGVDRSRGGCIVNGHTYCVAPIIQGGVVKKGVKQTYNGKQDLFMAGIDCCNCPVTDFRCGDWADPTHDAVGGMRLLDDGARKMYRLAAEKWGADYDKQSVHTIFFTWANDPVAAWKTLWHRGMLLTILAIVAAFFGSFLITLLLNGIIHFLIMAQIAAPIDEGEEKAYENDPLLKIQHEERDKGPWWVPEMYHAYENQKMPQLNEYEYAEAKHVVL